MFPRESMLLMVAIVRKVTPGVQPPRDDGMSEQERLRVMADPSRLAILEALRVEDTLTSAEIARLLPHAKGSMRYHLGLMTRAGFILRNGDGSWSARADAPLEWDVSDKASDPERAATYQLLDFITTHRRIGRMQRWEREKQRGIWEEWVDVEIGRDYAERFTREELRELDEAVAAVIEKLRAKAAARRAQSGSAGEQLSFVTFLGFPFALGEGPE